MTRKVKQFFNVKSFKDFANGLDIPVTDSAGVLIKENLKHIDPTIFEKKYPALAFLNSGIQADNSGGYSQVVESLRTLGQGEFKTSGDRSSDKGKISLKGETNLIQVISREAESEWSESDLQTAALQNINIQQKLLGYHLEQYQREVDAIIANGVADKAGSVGLLNNSDFATAASGDTIDNLSGIQAYEAIASCITDQHNAVNNTPEYMANAVMLPVNVYNHISREILNSAGSEKTILSALKVNFPDVAFYVSFRATKVCAYSTSGEAMKIRIPLALTVSPIVRLGFKYKVESNYRIAGLDILEASSGRYLTGL